LLCKTQPPITACYYRYVVFPASIDRVELAMIPRIFAAAAALLASLALADGPADNIPADVRRIPKQGVEVPAERKAKWQAGLTELGGRIVALRERKDTKTAELLPDVEIYFKAVNDALNHQEFFDAREFDFAD